MVIDTDKYIEFVKDQISQARSTDDIDVIMEEAKKFLQICFCFKED